MNFKVDCINQEEYNLLRDAFESQESVSVMVTRLDISFPGSYFKVPGSDKEPVLVNATGEFRLVPTKVLSDEPFLPFCTLKMDCKATSLCGCRDSSLEGFIREYGNGRKPFLIRARMAGYLGPAKFFFDGLHKADYEFILLQEEDDKASHIINVEESPPPMGADW